MKLYTGYNNWIYINYMPTLDSVTEVAFVGGVVHLSQAFQYRTFMSKCCWDKARVSRSPWQGE
jgi:hypothetical protein